jgi:hypothetical protein
MSTSEKIAAASSRLEETANENGGPYMEPENYRGSVARTMFDRPGSEDGTITALVPEHHIGVVARESFVRIPSIHPRTKQVEAEYLGVVASGPFAEPDALGAAAPTLVVAAANGAVLTPKYHGIAQIDVFGERIEGMVIPPLRRPCPNSPVFLLEDEDVKKIIGLDIAPEDKPVRLGLMDGASSLPVEIPAAKKSVLYKHTAILGTTGGGKSTTVSGAIMNFAEAGNAVVVFDIEGEYTTIDQPTTNPQMLVALKKRGLNAEGASNTRLFHLAGKHPANPSHPDIRSFKVAFDEFSPYVLAEVMDLSDAQERRLMDAYDIARVTMERVGIYPTNEAEQREAMEVDELQRGWPHMTVEMIIDVINLGIHFSEGHTADFVARAASFKGKEDEIKKVFTARKPEKDSRSWKAINKRLWRMKKANIFANVDAERIDVGSMLQPGCISIVDLSDMDAPYLRNLVIAQILRLLQLRQDELYDKREEAGRRGDELPHLPRVNIFIEEAHEFLSAQRIKQMPNLFDQVAKIARRGRKRYLGLVFVTQLPSHLPDEVLGLVNNWVLHKLTDTGVASRLRRLVPAVSEATWKSLPNLAPGQAVCSFTHLSRPITATMDPSPCQLRMVD